MGLKEDLLSLGTRKQRQPSIPRPELDALLEAAKHHVMTPQEKWDQRVSFVYGQLMDCSPYTTRREVEKRAAEIYGPRPEDKDND